VKKKKKGLLVVISGPSGVGKSTVVKRLFKIFPELKFSISATTRNKRPNEVDGKDYIFLSEKEFFDKVENDEFIEWAKVHNSYYGTPKNYVESQAKNGATVVLEVDVQGASKIKDLSASGKLNAGSQVFIFLIPPSVDILAFRLRKRRTEKTEEMNFRLRGAIAELQVMEKYDYIVVNDKVETAAEKVSAIINVEKERMILN
jgi:guanylate kinase